MLLLCVGLFDLVRAMGSSLLRRLTVRLNCIVCLREREQERCRRRRCRRLGIVDQDDDKTDDDGCGLREWKGGGRSFLAYWHQFVVLYTKSNHVFLFFFFPSFFFLADAVVWDPLTDDETNRKNNKTTKKNSRKRSAAYAETQSSRRRVEFVH